MLCLLSSLVAHYSVNGGDRGNVVRVADTVRQKTVADFPGEHGRVRLLVVGYCVHDIRGRHFGLRATDNARPDAARFVVSAKAKRPIRDVSRRESGSAPARRTPHSGALAGAAAAVVHQARRGE